MPIDYRKVFKRDIDPITGNLDSALTQRRAIMIANHITLSTHIAP